MVSSLALPPAAAASPRATSPTLPASSPLHCRRSSLVSDGDSPAAAATACWVTGVSGFSLREHTYKDIGGEVIE